jgi:putative transposase
MENVDINYCRKVKLYPNKPQLSLFNKCFNLNRYYYNKSVEYNNSKYDKKKKELENISTCIKCSNKLYNKYFCEKHKNSKINWDITTSFITLRKAIMKSDKDLKEDEKWKAEVPYDTRQLAIKSYTGALKACLSNMKNKNIDYFRMHYKSRKNPKQIFHVDKGAINGLKIFKRRLKNKSKIKTRKRYKCYDNYNPKHDCIIQKNNINWYLIIPKTRKTKFVKSFLDTVSLDPGERTFQTFYSPNGICGKIGDGISKELLNICKKIDNLNSLKSKLKEKKDKINLQQSKLRTKMRNVVEDMQWKACNYLVKNFQNIIIPLFETSKMKCYSKTNRSLRNLRHYSFLEKLKFKCKEYQRNLHLVTEEYTSKTCGRCGSIDRKLGSKKIYNCMKCGLIIDRDYNGARNILIKNLWSIRHL